MRVAWAIIYGKSLSPPYDGAVRLAQGITSYRRTCQGKELVHAVTVRVSLAHEATWQKLHQLLRLVSSWRSAAVTVAGQPVRYWALSGRLGQGQACYARKGQHRAGYSSRKNSPVRGA